MKQLRPEQEESRAIQDGSLKPTNTVPDQIQRIRKPTRDAGSC